MFEYVILKLEDIPVCSRRLLEEPELARLSEEVAFNIRLVLDELAANVVKHSKCRARISAERRGDLLHLTVRGECKFCPKRILPIDLFRECGRGVFLVRSVCAEFRYEEEGKTAVAAIQL